MGVISAINQHKSFSGDADADPLLPWLSSIKKGLDEFTADSSEINRSVLKKLVSDCIQSFKTNLKYQNDVRFLKVWFLHMDATGDFDGVFREIEECQICLGNSALYETYAMVLEAKGQLIDAHKVYCLGISRNAEPIKRLKKAHSLFLERMSEILKLCSKDQNGREVIQLNGKQSNVNPWSASTMNDLLQKILPHLGKYEGYHSSSKEYPGKTDLSTLQNSSRNKIIKIGGREYQIKGRAGDGGFAQVIKAYAGSDPDEAVVLKIQTPPFPWEFYIYRQLDGRIPSEERLSLGFARRMHHYLDYSILVVNYLSHGTLHDAINSYIFNPCDKSMEEVSCIYYTIEMLHILETLHSAGIIHGDFKPDNLLIRHSRKLLTDDIGEFSTRRGPWRDQGLCLVDWGRGIDLSLFPADIEFMGDCGTSGFRCVEMQEDKPWKYQVDTYGLCVIVHMMLHNSYMEIEKKASSDGSSFYMPKSPFKRSANAKLWESLFQKLLNVNPHDDHLKMLGALRESFQEVMIKDPTLVKKLKDSLRKQRIAVCSA